MTINCYCYINKFINQWNPEEGGRMHLEEISGQRSGCEKFFLTDDGGSILCQTADIREVAEFISEERPDIAEECAHQYEAYQVFTGSNDIAIALSTKNEQLFLGFLSSFFYEGNLSEQFNADEY